MPMLLPRPPRGEARTAPPLTCPPMPGAPGPEALAVSGGLGGAKVPCAAAEEEERKEEAENTAALICFAYRNFACAEFSLSGTRRTAVAGSDPAFRSVASPGTASSGAGLGHMSSDVSIVGGLYQALSGGAWAVRWTEDALCEHNYRWMSVARIRQVW